jgi:hypothetical protein
MKKKKHIPVLREFILTPTGGKLLIINTTEEYYICGVRYISRNDVLSGKYKIVTDFV